MPIVSELDSAMMQPARSLPALRRLGGGTILLNDSGRPLSAAGRNALVYELRDTPGRIVALRCLLRPDIERDRTLAPLYTALAEDPRLGTLRAAGGPLPRAIRWIDEGVTLRGADLQSITMPLVAMERIPGRTMAVTVDRLCREGRPEPLALLADAWLTTALALEEAEFSHGDLAADNLMVRPDGSIAVIDLDTASWPTAPKALPLTPGTAAYRHPRGVPRDAAQRDRFPGLVIWASLRILARHLALRERWGNHPDQIGMALLWSEDDLRRPERSTLFAQVDALNDEALQPLLEIIRRAIRFSPDETPPLSEIADRLDALGFPVQAAPAIPATRRRASPMVHPSAEDLRADPWPTVGAPAAQAPPARPDDWGREGQLRVDRQSAPIPIDRRQNAEVDRLTAALALQDAAAVQRLWLESQAIPEVALHAVAVNRLATQEATTAIDRAMRGHDDARLIAAVAGAELAGIAPSLAARTAVRQARQRTAAASALGAAIQERDYQAIGNLKRSGALEVLGRLEGGQARVVSRAVAWPALQRALATNDDVAIAVAADPALWREPDSVPERAWERLELARARLRWVDATRAALKARDAAALRGLLAGAPLGAEQRLTEVEGRRVLRVTMREAAVMRLEQALRRGPDREIVAALAEFEAAGAPFSDVLDWSAVRGVVDRISLADALRQATLADPPDPARLARLLPAARAALGEGGERGDTDWVALEASVLRAAHLARLREAIAAGDDRRIAAAADPDPYGARSLVSADEATRIEEALRRDQLRRSANA